jgi:hypothetical protein
MSQRVSVVLKYAVGSRIKLLRYVGSQGVGHFVPVPCHLEEMSKDGKGKNSVSYLAR